MKSQKWLFCSSFDELSLLRPIAAVEHCGQIWVLGGETSELFRYDPKSDEWSQLAISLPGPVER